MFKEKRMVYLEGGSSGEARGSLESKMESDNLAYHYAIGILKVSGIEGVEAEAILNDDTNPFAIYILNARGDIYKNSKDDAEKGEKLKTFMASKEYTRALNWQGLLLPGLKNALGKAGINYEMVKDRISFLVYKKDVPTLIMLNNIETGRLDTDTLNAFVARVKTKEMVEDDAKSELKGLSGKLSNGVNFPIDMKERLVEMLSSHPDIGDIGKISKISTETYNESSYQPSYGKHADTMEKLSDLVEEKENAETSSDEEFEKLNGELNDLINDVTEDNSELQDYVDQVNEVLSVVEDMANQDYSYSEIMEYLNSTDLFSKYEELYKAGVDGSTLDALGRLLDTRLHAILDHYEVEQVAETIEGTLEDSGEDGQNKE